MTRWGVPALGLAGAGFLLWGILMLGTLQPERIDDGLGMGGPAEPPIKQILTAEQEIDMDRYSDSWSPLPQDGPGGLLSTGRVGPLVEPGKDSRTMVIGKGQTFYEALAGFGAPHEDIMTIVEACGSFRNLRTVRAGEEFRVILASDGGLRSLGFDLDAESHVTWVRDGDTYRREDGTYPVERHLQGIGGTIEHSLYASLQKLDAPLSLAPKMNDILGWDIDFNRDLRQGDTFRIIFDEFWKDGKLLRTGAIQALEIVNKGKVRRAYQFTTADGRPTYYDEEGHNMQKQLMRAPLEYSRISSGFSYRRFHPVLKRWMPHLGIDYAAPLGTPVRAGGDGVVVACTWKKGNGRYIQIRHTNREYETFYLHLSRYAKNVKVGTKVSQGQIIGYVGASGYATGPHLDYRVKRNGKFVNPRNLKLPAAAPVEPNQMARFTAMTGVFNSALADLDLGSATDLPPLQVLVPPAWDSTAYAAASLPATVRSAN